MRKVVLVILASLLIGTAVVVACLSYRRLDVATIKEKVGDGLRYSAELTSYKSYYTGVVYTDKPVLGGLSKSFSLVRYKGVIRAGIRDMDSIQYFVSKDGGGVYVTMPKSVLLSNDIIEEEVLDSSSGIFRTKVGVMLYAIDSTREEMSHKMIEEGFLDDATVSSREAITALLKAMGFRWVEVRVVED